MYKKLISLALTFTMIFSFVNFPIIASAKPLQTKSEYSYQNLELTPEQQEFANIIS